jgi:hypothetical protein
MMFFMKLSVFVRTITNTCDPSGGQANINGSPWGHTFIAFLPPGALWYNVKMVPPGALWYNVKMVPPGALWLDTCDPSEGQANINDPLGVTCI